MRMNKKEEKDFSINVSIDKIKQKNYSFSAGQYFDVSIEYEDISQQEYEERIVSYISDINDLFEESRKLEEQIKKGLKGLKYNENGDN